MEERRASQAVDLYDYVPSVGSLPLHVRPPRAVAVSDKIRVTDDWPDVIPITEAELRVVEGHLGDVLDALFGPKP